MVTSREMLARLVAFKTVSRDANDAMVGFIAGLLRDAGFHVRVLPGTSPGKFNLLASIGPEAGDGLILSGHSDVVPVDGQIWATDPFTLTEREGRLHGRGSTDMKGFLAAVICAAQRLHRKTLSRPLHIAISHDEEIGCIGVRSMLGTLAAEGFQAGGCIVGEPTGLAVATGHKGKMAGCISCRGVAAHSANPALGVNAIYLAAGMVNEILALQEWLRAHGAHDAAYEVPHSTVHIGTIAGGTALNIVPDACDMRFEFRLLPGDAAEPLLERLRASGARLAAQHASGRACVEIVEQNAYPGIATPEQEAIVTLAKAALEDAPLKKLGFGSEAGLFGAVLGIPSIVCGPGDIDRAHKADEYVTTAELEACDRFLDNVLKALG